MAWKNGGVDRTLAILGGAGLDLAVKGRGRHRLTAASDPLFFWRVKVSGMRPCFTPRLLLRSEEPATSGCRPGRAGYATTVNTYRADL